MPINASSGCQLPKITVTIPYYMGWDNLVNTLRAVIAQRYPPDCYEIIVLNDGGPNSKGKWPTDVPRERVVWLERLCREEENWAQVNAKLMRFSKIGVRFINEALS